MSKRNSKIELLRIISIFLIVLSHYVVHSGANIHDLSFGFNKIILEMSILGNIGTMLFVLISGYFLINSDEVKLKKIIHFWLQVFFYSFFIYLLLLLINKETFDIKNLVLNSFPITFKRYWFATAYFILYLFHPHINKFLNSLSQREHFNFIILGVVIFYLLSTITTMNYYGNELLYFLIIYATGAYLSKYKNNFLYRNCNDLKIMISSIVLIFLSIILFEILGFKFTFFKDHSTYFLNMNSILVLLFSVSLFAFFARQKQSSNKTVNWISSLVFGIYLISDNKYLREIIWCNLLKNREFFSSNILVLHILSSAFIVCIVCILIELIRKKFFDVFVYKYLDNKLEKLDIFLKAKINSLNIE